MQTSGGISLTWQPAPQPDIVRAAQKDDLYLQQSVDACYDAFMRLFGAVPALQHSKSCRLLATFMYCALTTGAGLQTLGEEYCDIVQLKGRPLQLPMLDSSNNNTQQRQQQLDGLAPPQHLPSLATATGSSNSNQQQHLSSQESTLPTEQQRQHPLHLQTVMSYSLPPVQIRVLLVLLQLLGPTLVDRLAASLDRASDAGVGLASSNDGGSWRSDFDTAFHASRADEVDEYYGQQQQGDASFADLAEHGPSGSRSLLVQLKHSWRQALLWLAPRWPNIKPWMLLIGRLHLAAFYLNGTYYEWTKRLMGIRYTSISASKEPRASYRVLGLMLVVQLVISAVQQAQPQLSLLRHSLSSQSLMQKQGQQQPQHAIVLPESGSKSSSPGQQLTAPVGAGAASAWGSRQCPLCLSARTHPTCTPCGHVFCWHCIAQWCTEKPECPLCRTAVVSSQLVCVYHSDF